jgi:alkyl hydroperoxide reductase subunit AhpC
MAIRLGDTAPDFTADTTQGPVSFHAWKGNSWAVLFSHPKDFTPVCTTELGRAPDHKVKLTITYPASTGRNFDELLRVIDSLQLTANYSVATPADWKHGEDVIIVPAVSDEDAKTKFPKGFVAKKPYLRVTPQPNR